MGLDAREIFRLMNDKRKWDGDFGKKLGDKVEVTWGDLIQTTYIVGGREVRHNWSDR